MQTVVTEMHYYLITDAHASQKMENVIKQQSQEPTTYYQLFWRPLFQVKMG